MADSTERQNQRLPLRVSDHLAALNTPEYQDRGLAVYLSVLARLVDGEEYDGADMVGNWYHRNIRIYANILRAAEPGDRLLLLYGAGHLPVLTDLFEAAREFVLDDPMPYLTS